MSEQKYPDTPATMKRTREAMRTFARPTLSARYPMGNPKTATTRDGSDMTMDARNLLVPSSTSIPCRAGETAADPMSTIIDAIRSASFVSPDGLNRFPSAIVNCMMPCVLAGDTLSLCSD